MNSKSIPIVTASVSIVTLLLLYVGSYLVLLQPVAVESVTGRVLWRNTTYRVFDEGLQITFFPLNWADRELRPAYWGEPFEIFQDIDYKVDGISDVVID